MEPRQEMHSLIDELEGIINDAKPPLMSNDSRRVVDSEAIYAIIDDMRTYFPQEFAYAKRVCKEQDEIIGTAQQQAQAIIADAQQQAQILAGDQEVVRLAQQQADAIREQAAQYERDTRYSAEEYVDSLLSQLEDNLKNLTGQVARVKQTLDDNAERSSLAR